MIRFLFSRRHNPVVVTPAQAGVQPQLLLDSGLRRNDTRLGVIPRILFASLLFVAFTSPALAETKHTKGQIQMYWGSLNIGRMRINMNEEEYRYDVTFDLKMTGIIKLFAKSKMFIQSAGMIDDGSILPQHYQSRTIKSEETRIIDLQFDSTGALTFRKNEPKDDPNYRPSVSKDEILGAVDPLSGILKFRREAANALRMGQKEVNFKVYDGRRLYNVKFKLLQRMQKTFDEDDGTQKVIHLVAFREPIKGFTQKELARMKERDAPLHVYVSDDADMIPLGFTVDASFGRIDGVWKAD